MKRPKIRKYYKCQNGNEMTLVKCSVALDREEVKVLEEWATRCEMSLERLLGSYASDECDRQIDSLSEEN